MRKLYQTEWHGIQFKSFAKLSTTELADARFYEKFYQLFFQHNKSWEDIDKSWREQKSTVAEFILSQLNNENNQCVLSVGCGMGYVEHCLLDSGLSPNNLEVTDVSETSFRWLGAELPLSNIHIGFIPDCLMHKERSSITGQCYYDYVYSVAVEYTMKQNELIDFLANLKTFLRPDGRCLLISVSSEKDSIIESSKRDIKGVIKWLLHFIGIRKLGQFWGWIRTESEIQDAMKQAGFLSIKHGYIKTTTNNVFYWIEGGK